ncbi:TPA: hypothetical protein ACF4EV_002168 [Vibrio parahaemolyticus]
MTMNEKYIQPLLPLEYCSVNRAARLLGCEVGDILHWMEINAINAYFRFSQSGLGDDDNENSYTLKGYGTNVVEPEISDEVNNWMEHGCFEHPEELDDLVEPEVLFESEELTELEYLEDIDGIEHGIELIHTNYCSFIMKDSLLVPERHNSNSNIFWAMGVPKGIWQITNGYKFWDKLLISPEGGVDGVLMRPTPYNCDLGNWVLEYPLKLTLREIVLIREDLIKLHRAIQLGSEVELLANRINDETVAHQQKELEEKNKELSGMPPIGKKVLKQAHMINALIDSIPGLREKINASAKTKAVDVVIDHFKKHGVDFPQIDEKTMRNWMNVGLY